MFENDEPHVVIEDPNLDEFAIAPLGGTEWDVLDNVCKVIFLILLLRQLMKEIVVVVDDVIVGC